MAIGEKIKEAFDVVYQAAVIAALFVYYLFKDRKALEEEPETCFLTEAGYCLHATASSATDVPQHQQQSTTKGTLNQQPPARRLHSDTIKSEATKTTSASTSTAPSFFSKFPSFGGNKKQERQDDENNVGTTRNFGLSSYLPKFPSFGSGGKAAKDDMGYSAKSDGGLSSFMPSWVTRANDRYQNYEKLQVNPIQNRAGSSEAASKPLTSTTIFGVPADNFSSNSFTTTTTARSSTRSPQPQQHSDSLFQANFNNSFTSSPSANPRNPPPADSTSLDANNYNNYYNSLPPLTSSFSPTIPSVTTTTTTDPIPSIPPSTILGDGVGGGGMRDPLAEAKDDLRRRFEEVFGRESSIITKDDAHSQPEITLTAPSHSSTSSFTPSQQKSISPSTIVASRPRRRADSRHKSLEPLKNDVKSATAQLSAELDSMSKFRFGSTTKFVDPYDRVDPEVIPDVSRRVLQWPPPSNAPGVDIVKDMWAPGMPIPVPEVRDATPTPIPRGASQPPSLVGTNTMSEYDRAYDEFGDVASSMIRADDSISNRAGSVASSAVGSVAHRDNSSSKWEGGSSLVTNKDVINTVKKMATKLPRKSPAPSEMSTSVHSSRFDQGYSPGGWKSQRQEPRRATSVLRQPVTGSVFRNNDSSGLSQHQHQQQALQIKPFVSDLPAPENYVPSPPKRAGTQPPPSRMMHDSGRTPPRKLSPSPTSAFSPPKALKPVVHDERLYSPVPYGGRSGGAAGFSPPIRSSTPVGMAQYATTHYNMAPPPPRSREPSMARSERSTFIAPAAGRLAIRTPSAAQTLITELSSISPNNNDNNNSGLPTSNYNSAPKSWKSFSNAYKQTF